MLASQATLSLEDGLQNVSLSAIADLCKASADPLRLQVLRLLQGESFGVSELCTLLDIRQSALSHHLKVLAGAGLVATRREGNSIFYRRMGLGQRPELEALQQQIFHTVDQIALPDELMDRLKQLHNQREANSRRFFTDNAHKFHEQQDLIASYGQYADTVAQMLDDADIPSHELALEIGPGDGAFLATLAQRFNSVVAIDNASQMLEKAQESVSRHELGNVTLLLGDTGSSEIDALRANCVVINMVLHHTPKPAQILRDVSRCLAPGGVVVVTDLCQHDQGWARDNCGDLWLGFEPTALTYWAEQAGLCDIASVYLAQRNGFQVQVRLFGHPHTQKEAA
ncbi:MAG: metalloregulator ArsR/SmtB family transcription factor [Halioglobus sp.]